MNYYVSVSDIASKELSNELQILDRSLIFCRHSVYLILTGSRDYPPELRIN